MPIAFDPISLTITMSGAPNPYDGRYQPGDELGSSQFQENDGGESCWNGEDDGNPATQATPPTAVDESFQPQQSEFFDLLPSFDIPEPGLSWTGVEASSDWADFEVSSNLFADWAIQNAQSWDAEHLVVVSDQLLAWFTSEGEQSTAATAIPLMVWEEEDEATLLQPPAGPMNAREQSTAAPMENDEETLLKRLRAAGYGYAAISEKMREELGIEVTANALVKRYQKLPKTCENVVANAITNIMPQIMEQIYVELPYMDDGTLSEEEKQIVDRMLQDLPQILPNCVRGSLSRKRRTMQPSPSL
ncbi:hypothetical protein F5144DRAFT_88882 [Chaetomium tenue]|uniref:Uncharacterized protein n=1 Tax=Chaetomium tenue TaxID=1854479 RepID=A0ACB7PGQ5_9PEZI|nr:hypothetical protein F5144DRAFT_88882 [Chaetomium globosum]